MSVIRNVWRTLTLSQHRKSYQIGVSKLSVFKNSSAVLLETKQKTTPGSFNCCVFFQLLILLCLQQKAVLFSDLYMENTEVWGALFKYPAFGRTKDSSQLCFSGLQKCPTNKVMLSSYICILCIVNAHEISTWIFHSPFIISRHLFFSFLLWKTHFILASFIASIRSSHGLILMFAVLLTQCKAWISETSSALYILSAV